MPEYQAYTCWPVIATREKSNGSYLKIQLKKKHMKEIDIQVSMYLFLPKI